MSKGKHRVENKSIIYSILLIIATLFIGIANAEITTIEPIITGEVTVTTQDGIFITDVVYAFGTGIDSEKSTINYYVDTMMESNIVLGETGSSITYKVTVYNNTDKEQVFIGVLTDKTDAIQYSNTNIEYSVSSIGEITGLEEYATKVAPGKSITFPVTFSYVGEDISNNTLLCKLNFRFKEVPTIELDNEGETYFLEDFYPGITPYEQIFTVTNYTETKTNSVPMTYNFEAETNGPFTAKIYNVNGEEVTDVSLKRRWRK